MSKPEIPGRLPVVVDLEAGTYAWCACGRSQTQPFCDGSHVGTDISPKTFELTEPKRVALCLCKHAGKAPFCDGSHRNL